MSVATELLGLSDEVLGIVDAEGLRKRCMGNIELMRRVLDQFARRLPDDLAELENAVEQGEWEKAARTAHYIKGASANVSAEGLWQIIAEIEDLTRSGQTAAVPSRLEQLRTEWKRWHGAALRLLTVLDNE